MDFQEVANAIDTISNHSSKLDKQYLLKKYAALDGFKDVLKFIFDPYFTTGLKAKKLDNCNFRNLEEITPEEAMLFLRFNSTGSDAAANYALNFIYQYDSLEEQRLATAIVTKDLQIGVSVTTLNRIFGEAFIPVIGIMRGMLCPDTIQGIYLATEKIDGNRRLIFNHADAGVKIYTRSGKPDDGLYQIAEEARELPTGYVYDTECVAQGKFADSIELRQASASILNSRGKRGGVQALAFDMLPIEEYNKRRSKYSAFARKAILATVCGDYADVAKIGQGIQQLCPTYHSIPELLNVITAPFITEREPYEFITALPILGVVNTKQQALDLATPIWETGGEGIMLVDIQSPYEVNPNPRNTLLKIKASKEYVLKCIDVCEGDNKYTGSLGAIVVEYPKEGKVYTVKVGSGFTDALRDKYFDNPEGIIGKYVEVESFGESRNAQGEYSLNCPIFKRVRGDKE